MPILECINTEHIRQIISAYYIQMPCMYKCIQLLSCDSQAVVIKLLNLLHFIVCYFIMHTCCPAYCLTNSYCYCSNDDTGQGGGGRGNVCGSQCKPNTVDLVIFACLNFLEYLILGLSRGLDFVNFHFSSVALL